MIQMRIAMANSRTYQAQAGCLCHHFRRNPDELAGMAGIFPGANRRLAPTFTIL
jgi:hypothetical protein